MATRTVAGDAVDAAEVVVQVAVPGNGTGPPGRDGGGPPISVDGHAIESSVDVPKAARQGSEARRVGGSRVRPIPTPRGGLHRSTFQDSSCYT